VLPAHFTRSRADSMNLMRFSAGARGCAERRSREQGAGVLHGVLLKTASSAFCASSAVGAAATEAGDTTVFAG